MHNRVKPEAKGGGWRWEVEAQRTGGAYRVGIEYSLELGEMLRSSRIFPTKNAALIELEGCRVSAGQASKPHFSYARA